MNGASGVTTLLPSLLDGKSASVVTGAVALAADAANDLGTASSCAAVTCGARGRCSGGKCLCDAASGFSGPQCDVAPSPIDAVYTEWSAWTPCTVPCGGGVQSRFRRCDVDALYGGVPCQATALAATQPCNVQSCVGVAPSDAEFGEWAPWGVCSAECPSRASLRKRLRLRGVETRRRPCLLVAGCTPGGDTQTRTCVQACAPPVKACPGSSGTVVTAGNLDGVPTVQCSGNGQCVYTAGSELPDGVCRVGDLCTARCACDAGFSGKACALTPAEVEERRQLRSDLMQAQRTSWLDLVQDGEVDQVTVQAHADALLSVVSDTPDELDADTRDTVLLHIRACSQATGSVGVDAAQSFLDVVSSLFEEAQSSALVAGAGARRLLRPDRRLQAVLEDARAVAEDATNTIHVVATSVMDGVSTGANGTVLETEGFVLSIVRDAPEVRR